MFIFAKVDENTEKTRNELFTFYHGEFIKALQTFGYSKQPPSLKDFHDEFNKRKPFEVLFIICFAPYSFMDLETTHADSFFNADLEKKRNFKKSLFNHPVCTSVLKKALKKWEEMGCLDIE
jgi:hypothetical protein